MNLTHLRDTGVVRRQPTFTVLLIRGFDDPLAELLINHAPAESEPPTGEGELIEVLMESLVDFLSGLQFRPSPLELRDCARFVLAKPASIRSPPLVRSIAYCVAFRKPTTSVSSDDRQTYQLSSL